MSNKTCITPKCSKTELVEIPLENTLTMKKYYCPSCGRIYGVVTPAGKAAQVAPAVTAGVILAKFVIAIAGSVIGHDDVDVFH